MKKLYAFMLLFASSLFYNLRAQEGKIDSSFGTNGYAYGGIIASGAGGRPVVLIQPDQKILQIASPLINGNLDIEVLRFLSDGTPDISFNGNGKLLLDLGSKEVPQCIALQSDGKIVLGGHKDGLIMLVRLNPDGSLDNTFNGQGWKQYDVFSIGGEQYASSLAVQPDGKIVASVAVFLGNASVKDFIVMRVDAAGNLDLSFNGSAVQLIDMSGGEDYAMGIVIGPDGKMIIGGLAVRAGSSGYRAALTRLMPNGGLDPAFGINGKTVINIGDADDNLNDLILQPDGKILFGGYAYRTATNYDFFVARLLVNGTLDNSFGNGGIAFKDFNNGLDIAYGLDIQNDGKIVQSGNATVSSEPAFCSVLRYTTSGVLDNTFGTNGYAAFDLGPGHGFYGGAPLQSVKVQQNGKIVAGGLARIPGGQFGYLTNENVLIRFMGTSPTSISDQVSNFNGRFIVKHVLLNWWSVNYNTIAHFNIQRSADSLEFQNVGSIQSHTTRRTPYFFVDHVNHLLGYPKLYYRLEVVDKDGTKKYSHTITVYTYNCNADTKNLLTVVSPLQTQELKVQYMGEQEERGTLLVYTTDGKLITKKEVTIVAGRNQWNTWLPTNVNGMLIVQLRTGGNIITRHVMR